MSVARSRFAARRRRIRWQSARPLVAAVTAVLVLGMLAWVVLASPLLAVNRLTVQGIGRLTRADIVSAARVAAGTPLARVDVGAVRGRIAALPPVESVRVARDWPHTLTVVVRERTAVATIPAAGGVVLLDAHGVAFGKDRHAPRGTVPLQLTAPVPGEGQASARAALAVWRALPERVRVAVVGLRATSPSDVTLTLRGGRSVVWGAASDIERKAAVLDVLLQRPARVYDVSAPGVAVTR